MSNIHKLNKVNYKSVKSGLEYVINNIPNTEDLGTSALVIMQTPEGNLGTFVCGADLSYAELIGMIEVAKQRFVFDMLEVSQ